MITGPPSVHLTASAPPNATAGGEPTPPLWWKGDGDAAQSSFQAARQIRR